MMAIDPRIAHTLRAMFAMAEHFHLKGGKVSDAECIREPSSPARWSHLEPSNVLIVNGQRVGVKALNDNFTDKHDWPWRQFTVCGQHEHETNPCALYVQVSNDCRYAAIVKAGTRTAWFPVGRVPYPDGAEEGFQMCPMEHVQFVKLEKAS